MQTDTQADLIKELDCDEIQGFLIARPMAAADIDEFLAGYNDAETGLLRAVTVGSA